MCSMADTGATKALCAFDTAADLLNAEIDKEFDVGVRPA